MRAAWFLALLATVGHGCGPTMASIIPNLLTEQKRQPIDQPEDLYKFIHQAALGNAHILEHGDAKLYLLEEWDEIEANVNEQLLVDLSPDGRVVRLNLRPYKARSGTTDSLWTAMERSAVATYDGPEALEHWWNEAVNASVSGMLPFDPDMLRTYLEDRKAEGFPAAHHSPSYEDSYRPSYRVLLREEAERLL